MISTIWVILILSVVVGAWLACIERAMLHSTPIVLRHELEIRGTPQRALWISKKFESILQSVALVRIMCFLALICSFIFLLSPDGLTYWSVLGGLAIAGIVNWFFSSVVAGAIAQVVPLGTVTSGWLLLRLVSVAGIFIGGPIRVVGEIVRRLSGANLSTEGSNGVEEKLLLSIEHSQLEGGIPAEAAEMLENVVDFGTTDVGEIMTPRTDIDGIELTHDLSEIRTLVLASGRSRIPVYEENLDQIIGILYAKDLIEYLGADANGFELNKILRKPIVVPETKSVLELLADFQTSEVHMAVVIDEYGGTAGLVTIEDVLEEIVGEIRDEHDDTKPIEPVLDKIDASHIEVDGRFPLDDLNDELSIQLPEDEEYDTIAGFVLANLGHVPRVGETLETHGMSITTLEATETQIDRLSINFSDS
ncbi:MAG TPA: HlyC/CorC family transporter, partial [Phycisphaerales bacterium]|nr:HlyC/CorC family transporter [Phycisphaerales bacterium]